MPSRKRSKGKERKLKQQARQSVSSSSPPPAVGNVPGAFQLPRGHPVNDFITTFRERFGFEDGDIKIMDVQRVAERHTECGHGAFQLPRGHPVNDFISTFQEGCVFEDGDMKIMDAMCETFEKHEDVWEDSTLRKMAINYMLRMGTDLLLDNFSIGARRISEVIISLENYDGEGTFTSMLSKGTEEVVYLLRAEMREVVHFYKKRIPCSCLDKLYSELKKCQVRGSICCHCRQTVKSKDLKTCSRCKSAQYCSKECQTLDWPSHKEGCKVICPIHENLKKGKNYKKEGTEGL